jgi:transcriptional regulator with XRE-family HTH domain
MADRDEDLELTPTADTAGQAAARSGLERRYMSELGHRLRQLREERGLTQQAVARSAGVATDMVSRLENGHYTSPGLRTLLRIAEGMGVAVSALLPDLPAVPAGSGGVNPRARLLAFTARMTPEELEIVTELAEVIARRRRA